MKNLFKEILQIILAIILLFGGLALVLVYGKYLDGRGLLGLAMMAIGSLIFTVFARGLVVRKW